MINPKTTTAESETKYTSPGVAGVADFAQLIVNVNSETGSLKDTVKTDSAEVTTITLASDSSVYELTQPTTAPADKHDNVDIYQNTNFVINAGEMYVAATDTTNIRSISVAATKPAPTGEDAESVAKYPARAVITIGSDATAVINIADKLEMMGGAVDMSGIATIGQLYYSDGLLKSFPNNITLKNMTVLKDFEGLNEAQVTLDLAAIEPADIAAQGKISADGLDLGAITVKYGAD